MGNKTAAKYETTNPKKAKVIKKAVLRGLKQYEETFRRLASGLIRLNLRTLSLFASI